MIPNVPRLALMFSAMFLAMAGSSRAADFDLGPYKGKVVYLDFWASWCTPCHLSFPWMNDIQQQYGSAGLVVIAVDVDRDRAAADEFLAANRGALQIVYDPKGAIAGKYAVKGMPTAVLIGRDGKVHSLHDGFIVSQEERYLADVVALLHQQ
ncbi:MAG TPA: TlpA disulfide reductase family protein [Rhizomicrobium sp.]|nr:TlpA disulfide reductase family protein [Rhizomicrobium sp.]